MDGGPPPPRLMGPALGNDVLRREGEPRFCSNKSSTLLDLFMHNNRTSYGLAAARLFPIALGLSLFSFFVLLEEEREKRKESKLYRKEIIKHFENFGEYLERGDVAKEKEGKIVRCISPSGCYYRDSIIVFAIGRFIFNNGECAHHKVSNFTIKSRLSLGYHSKVERGWIQLRPWLLVSWSLSLLSLLLLLLPPATLLHSRRATVNAARLLLSSRVNPSGAETKKSQRPDPRPSSLTRINNEPRPG